MPTYEADDIADLVVSTQKDLGELRFSQIATRLQGYECMGRVLKADSTKIESGEGIQRNVMVDHSDSADTVGLFEDDDVSFKDVMQTLTVPWRHSRTYWMYERREMLMNRGSRRLLDLIKVRRTASMIAMAELLEQEFWSSPPSSSDKTHLFGVPYWITQSDTEGFNGADHGNFSSGKGGLSATTYTRWKNYTGKYVSVDKGDLIQLMRNGHRKTNWRSPVSINDYRKGNGQRFRVYCGNSVISDFERVGEGQNENLGRDLASMDGKMTFRGHPIIWVPYLDDSSITNAPVYMIDFNDFYIHILSGDYLRESKPTPSALQHNTYVCFVDLTANIVCTNVRHQAVFTTTADSTP